MKICICKEITNSSFNLRDGSSENRVMIPVRILEKENSFVLC